MGAQSTVSIGIDVAKLSAEAAEVHAIFVKLFDELHAYDGNYWFNRI